MATYMMLVSVEGAKPVAGLDEKRGFRFQENATLYSHTFPMDNRTKQESSRRNKGKEEHASNKNDCWAQIKERAARRANRAYEEETSGEESIRAGVTRIKSRVAENTSGANSQAPKLGDNRASSSKSSIQLPRVPSGFRGKGYISVDRKLGYILDRLQHEETRKAFESLGVSDLWLPLKKQTLLRLGASDREARSFLSFQNDVLDTKFSVPPNDGSRSKALFVHATLEDDEDLVAEIRTLGEGAHGTVDEVSLSMGSRKIVCVRKRMGRSNIFSAHQKVMEAFARELNVMSQVNHPHCVQFLGSYTDPDHVNIISAPVADMDLATFLDQPLTEERKSILNHGIYCLCNAIDYLHMNNIRHEDLKPQNVLVRRQTILITDFGFSLDFSDDFVSTTMGRPAAWTMRYSAPEVLNFEPRNRATDMFSLGCILTEMMSGLCGISYTEVRSYWKKTGNGLSTFAQNPEAGFKLLQDLQHSLGFRDVKLSALCDFIPFLLDANRLHRPAAQQVVNRLLDLRVIFSTGEQPRNTECCPENSSHGGSSIRSIFGRVQHFGYLGPFFYPWQYPGWVYGLWDMNLNLLCTNEKNIGEYNEFEHNHKVWILEQQHTISTACDTILNVACTTGTTKEFWEAPNNKAKAVSVEKEHVRVSAHIFSLQHAVFTRLPLLVGHPSSSGNAELGYIQITLLPVCLRRSPYYGNFFWMFSYEARYGGHISQTPVRPGDIIDLTTIG